MSAHSMDGSVSSIKLAAAVALLVLAYWAYSAVVWRRTKQFAAWPQLKPSLLLGHAAIVGKKLRNQPPKSHSDYMFMEMADELGRPPAFVVDFRPLSYPILVITNHALAEQISRPSKPFPYSIPKSPTVKGLLPLTGPESLLIRDGEAWKGLRRQFNPGFSPKYLLSKLGCILDKTELFLGHLDRLAANGEVFELHNLTVSLTFDIIGTVVADAEFCAQMPEDRQSIILKEYKALIATYRDPPNPAVESLNFPTHLRRWMITKRLDRHLDAHIRKHFEEQRRREEDGQAGGSARSRSVISLGLEGIKSLDDEALRTSRDQIKTFLFAGHDTTSIALQWAIYEVYRRPGVLAKLRAELAEVFGDAAHNPAVVRERLLSQGGEETLSRLPYLYAVFRETLRLYAPASTARYVPSGTDFRLSFPDGAGETPRVDGMVLYVCHYQVQRDRTVYGEDADEFVPERWLGYSHVPTGTDGTDGGPTDEKQQQQDQQDQQRQQLPASAWRPFERGPRNCIGQELATLEFRVIMACTVARYDFEKIGLGEAVKDEKGAPVLTEKGHYHVKADLYNMREVTAKPVDGTRMRVRLSDKARSKANGK